MSECTVCITVFNNGLTVTVCVCLFVSARLLSFSPIVEASGPAVVETTD